MAKQSSVNLDITNNADGFDISGGTTVRKLGITGGDVTIAGSGSATVTFPTTSTTIAGLGISQTFTALQSFSAGISAAGGITFASRIQGVGATFTGIVEIDTGLILPNSQNITSAVTTFNGASGAVSFAVPLASSSVTGVASFGNEFVVTSGAVGLTSNYVKSVNGLTGAVVSIAVTGSNTFTGLQTMNAGITSNNLWVTNGATFASRAAFPQGFTANNVFVNGGATFAGANIVAFAAGLTTPYVNAGQVLSDTIDPRTTGGDLYLNTGGGNVTYIGDYGGAGNSTYIQVNDNSGSISLNGFVQTNDRVSVGGYLEVASGGVVGSGTELNYTRTALTTTGANQTIWEKIIGPLEIPFTASHRSAELFVQATRGATFESFKMIVGHTNVDTYNTEYAVVRSGPVLGTYTTTLVDVSTDRFLRLRVTPSLTGTTFMVYSTLLPT